MMPTFKRFRDFAESKEKGFADKNGSIPNQDIPKAHKGPELLKMKDALASMDYRGNLTTNPIKGGKEDPLPYKGYAKNDQDKRQGLLVYDDGDAKAGFAFKGNKVLTPKNSAPLGEKPTMGNIQKIKSKGKMTSEEFIQETKDMSPADFVSFFVEGSDEPLPTVTDLYGNEFTPDPSQTIEYMAALMVKNPRLLSRFVREMKRHEKGMNMMMDENFSHPEFYANLAEGMAKPEEGRKRCHRIGRAMNDQYMEALEKFVIEQKMNEEVQPKADLSFEDGGPMGSTPQNPSGMPPKPGMGAPGAGYTPQMGGGAFGGGGPGGPQPTAGGGAMGGGGVGNPPGATGGMGGGADGMPSAGGMPAPGAPGATPGAGGPPGMPPGAPPGAGGSPGLDMGSGQQPGGALTPKLKGETAHGNMIEEMGGFPHMFAHMADYCINCKDKKKQ